MEQALEALKQSLLDMLGAKMDWHIRALTAEAELAKLKAAVAPAEEPAHPAE